MAWFQRLNHQGVHHISNEAFTTAVALHLSLPIAAFEGLTCGCGCKLTGDSGPLHIVSCNQFAKLPRSETFQHAVDSIIHDVCKDARIEGAKQANGQQVPCQAYATVPVKNRDGTPKLDGAGVPMYRNIVPDRVVRQMIDSDIGPSGRYIVDTAIPCPEAAHHLASGSATEALTAAARTYARKFATYAPVLKPQDKLMAVVCESWGGLHTGMRKQLRRWAFFVSQQADREDQLETDCLSPQVIAIWKMRLSCALLLGRVNLVFQALDKLQGVPARTKLLAYRITHVHHRAREFGQLRLSGRYV